MNISPAPTDEEAAAIMAAYEVLRPRVVVVAAAAEVTQPVWRFSGRWWSRPIPSRRSRP
jgi:hypothetical protein